MSKSTRERVRENEQKQCDVKGCWNYRNGLSRFCTIHRSRVRYYGDPHASNVDPKEYADIEKEVLELFKLNRDNLGYLKAVKAIESWTEDALNNKPYTPGVKLMIMLYDRGRTPEEILARLCAFRIYTYTDPYRIPSKRAEDVGLFRSLTKLSVSYGHYEIGEALEIGNYIHKIIGVFMLYVKQALMKRNSHLASLQDGFQAVKNFRLKNNDDGIHSTTTDNNNTIDGSPS